MSHPDQLREYARDCLRLSQDMTSPNLKIHLINMAEAWAALAVQSERIASLSATVTAQDVAERPQAGEQSAAGMKAPDRPLAESRAGGAGRAEAGNAGAIPKDGSATPAPNA